MAIINIWVNQDEGKFTNTPLQDFDQKDADLNEVSGLQSVSSPSSFRAVMSPDDSVVGDIHTAIVTRLNAGFPLTGGTTYDFSGQVRIENKGNFFPELSGKLILQLFEDNGLTDVSLEEIVLNNLDSSDGVWTALSAAIEATGPATECYAQIAVQWNDTIDVGFVSLENVQIFLDNLSMLPPFNSLFATANVTNNIVNGGTDGAITLKVTGGVAPYTYAWLDGPLTKDRSNLAAGFYSVTITDDAATEFDIINIEVTEPGISAAAQGFFGLKISWQDWLELLTAPNEFYDANLKNNGKNQKTSRYSGVGGFDIRTEVRTRVSKGGISTIYSHLSQPINALDYDQEQQNANLWEPCLIETFDESDNNLGNGGILLNGQLTKIKITFAPVAPYDPELSTFYGIVRIEEEEQPGFSIWESSTLRGIPTGSLLTQAVLTKEIGNLVLRAETVPQNLGVTPYKLSGKIDLKDGSSPEGGLDYELDFELQ